MTEGGSDHPKKGCPICGKPPGERHRPFCSARCAQIDLGRWLKGVYRIPTQEEPAEAAPSGEEPEDAADGNGGRREGKG